MSAQPAAALPQLRWRKPDEYHITTTCGGWKVSRITVEPSVWYIAWRVIDQKPNVELGSRKLAATTTDEQRKRAIGEMQALCEADAATVNNGRNNGEPLKSGGKSV